MPDIFPARFPLKVIGSAEADFIEQLKVLFDRHTASWEPQHLRTNLSKDKRYLAVTAMVTVASKQQMQDLYAAIKVVPDVLMCL